MATTIKDEPLGRLIYHMAQDLGRFAEKILNPFDLTLEQLHILKTMPRDGGMTQKDIGAAVGKTPANMTRILDRLEEKSLIQRQRDPKDRRATLVFMTENGKKTAEKVTDIFESFSIQFQKGVTDQELRIIRAAFAKMSANLRKIDAKP
jgi:DNA-binding MarR family transcriptional regulator